MVEHGLYAIKKEFFNIVKNLGGDCDVNNGYKRPVYCCIKDNIIKGLYWAIPTSDLSHRTDNQKQNYDFFLGLPDDDLRSCYYHKAKTTKEALYKISSCFPITSRYIDHEYTTSGKHVVMQRKESISEIERKLRRILAMEFSSNNYFPQHISEIRIYLMEELSVINVEEEIASTKNNE